MNHFFWHHYSFSLLRNCMHVIVRYQCQQMTHAYKNWLNGCMRLHRHWTLTLKPLYVIWTPAIYSVSNLLPCVWSMFTGRRRLKTPIGCDLYSLLLSLLETEYLIGLEGVVYTCTRSDPSPHTHYWMLSFIIQEPSELRHAFSASLCHSHFLLVQSLIPLQSLVAFDLKQNSMWGIYNF